MGRQGGVFFGTAPPWCPLICHSGRLTGTHRHRLWRLLGRPLRLVNAGSCVLHRPCLLLEIGRQPHDGDPHVFVVLITKPLDKIFISLLLWPPFFLQDFLHLVHGAKPFINDGRYARRLEWLARVQRWIFLPGQQPRNVEYVVYLSIERQLDLIRHVIDHI